MVVVMVESGETGRTAGLPTHILDEPPSEPVITVDGLFEEAESLPGLNLSHWPGNGTPAHLKRDLSTGIALAFIDLDPAEQERLAAGCTAIVNTHYDTDGVLAMFTLVRPEQARPRAEAMLDAAAAGDFFTLPSLQAFRLDCIVSNLVRPERSPLDLAGLSDRERHERATDFLLERLPALLDGELEPLADLWTPESERLEEDLALLEGAALDELVHLDLSIWTLPGEGDPGRHALFGKSTTDRHLVLAPTAGGTTARLIVGTRSWFELAGQARQPRPDLEALLERLKEEAESWQLTDPEGASPELWFGRAGLESFAEHAGAYLLPCPMDPLRIKAAVVDAVREVWVFSEDEEDQEAEAPWSFPA